MTPSATTICTAAPNESGAIASKPWTTWMSEMERETICPVRIWCWLRPSRCSRVSSRRRRRLFCTLTARRPANTRRPKWQA